MRLYDDDYGNISYHEGEVYLIQISKFVIL